MFQWNNALSSRLSFSLKKEHKLQVFLLKEKSHMICRFLALFLICHQCQSCSIESKKPSMVSQLVRVKEVMTSCWKLIARCSEYSLTLTCRSKHPSKQISPAPTVFLQHLRSWYRCPALSKNPPSHPPSRQGWETYQGQCWEATMKGNLTICQK